MAAATHVMDVSEATFERDVINASRQKPVVVDFWAPWCGPCRMLGPVLEKLAKEANGAWTLVKLNTDENQGVAMRYGIQGIPAVKAFKDGKVVSEFVGAQPEPQVRQFIQKLVPAPGQQAADAAAKLLADHRWPEAEAAYRRTAAAQASPAEILGLAKALVAQGKGQEAEQALEKCKGDGEVDTAERLQAAARWLVMAQATDGSAGTTGAEALYLDAGKAALKGDIQGALDGLLSVLRRDKRYAGGEAQRIMLAYFSILGDADPLTREYRTKLAALLF